MSPIQRWIESPIIAAKLCLLRFWQVADLAGHDAVLDPIVRPQAFEPRRKRRRQAQHVVTLHVASWQPCDIGPHKVDPSGRARR